VCSRRKAKSFLLSIVNQAGGGRGAIKVVVVALFQEKRALHACFFQELLQLTRFLTASSSSSRDKHVLKCSPRSRFPSSSFCQLPFFQECEFKCIMELGEEPSSSHYQTQVLCSRCSYRRGCSCCCQQHLDKVVVVLEDCPLLLEVPGGGGGAPSRLARRAVSLSSASGS
jgi:hypothetical protein